MGHQFIKKVFTVLIVFVYVCATAHCKLEMTLKKHFSLSAFTWASGTGLRLSSMHVGQKTGGFPASIFT